MKNNKMNREEKRRLLFNKKYEISDTLHNDAETAPAGAGAAEGMLFRAGALTKKQLRALIAILVAVAVVLPGLLVGIHVFGAETKAIAQKESEDMETIKTVDYDAENKVAHIRIDAYATKASLEMVPTDNVLVLERSEKMEVTLYGREYTNLKTNTIFKSFEDLNNSLPTHNDLYDKPNPNNVNGGSTIQKYANNKYIKDPNNPDQYLYLSQTFERVYRKLNSNFRWSDEWSYTDNGLAWLAWNRYKYTIIDSNGNKYETDYYNQFLGATIWNQTLPGDTGSIAESGGLSFTWTQGPDGLTAKDGKSASDYNAVDSFNVSTKKDFFQRQDDNSLNSTLWEKYKTENGLYIKDDNGNLHYVEMDFIHTNTEEKDPNNYCGYYTYTLHETDEINSPVMKRADGSDFVAYYGNSEYGADYSVFQGFKSYVHDSNGDLVYDSSNAPMVDHANSLEHKTLYSGAHEDVSRLLAMQEACEDFIIDLHRAAYENGQISVQKVGVVSYASSSEGISEAISASEQAKISRKDYPLTDIYYESNIYPIIQTIYSYQASGRRRLDVGMRHAKGLLENDVGAGFISWGDYRRYDADIVKEKNVAAAPTDNVNIIAFTAGVCSDKVNGDFKTDYANQALSYAKDIETEFEKTKIYTIGMFQNADESQLHGNWFYRTTHANQYCDGSVNSYWGGTATSGWANSEMDEKDTAAMNRFLNYLSSNYAKATNLGITRGYIHPGGWSFGGTGYRINSNLTPTGEGYYYAAGDAEQNEGASLKDAFKKIAESVIVPNAALNEETTIRDSITTQFKNITNVKAFTSIYNNDNGTWEDHVNETLNTEDSTSDTVVVKGFNYGENYFSAPNQNIAGNYGKKAVLTFDVSVDPDFLGGHDVYTNGSDSGFYSADGLLVESFNRPTVDIDPEPDVTTHNQKIYRTSYADLRESFDSIETNGDNNAYVDIKYVVKDSSGNQLFTYTIPAGEQQGYYDLTGEDEIAFYTNQLKDTTDYSIDCVMTTVSDNEEFSMETPGTSTIFVYNPVVTVEDDRVDYSVATDPQRGVNLTPSITWEASVPEGKTAPNGLPEGPAPDVTYSIDKLTAPTDNILSSEPKLEHYNINKTSDFQVKDVTIKGTDGSFTTTVVYYITTTGEVLASEYEKNPSGYTLVTDPLVDDEGNEIKDENNQTIRVPRTRVDTNHIVAIPCPDEVNSEANKFVRFVTLDLNDHIDSDRRNGEFTIYTGTPYKLHIVKQFDGPMAIPEGIKFTVTDDSGNAQNITISNYNHLTGEATTNLDLMSDVEYTIAESKADGTPLEEPKYSATATKSLNGGTVVQLTPKASTTDTNFDFTFVVTNAELETLEENQRILTITVKNTDSTQVPPATGYSESDTSNRVLLIALAATATVSAGGYGIYRVYRPRKEAN